MSLRLTFRKTRGKGKRKTGPGSFYIEGTDHKGERVHESLSTSDRDLAKREFAKRVARTLDLRTHGDKAAINFSDACELYCETKGENTNKQWLERMAAHTWFGAKKLCEITQTDLNKLAKDLYPGCVPATLKRQVYTPFLAAYNACVDHEPPLADRKRWKAPQVIKKTVDAPDDGYIEALIAAARHQSRAGKRNNVVKGSRNPERDIAAILFITLTGCRSGEAQRVRLKDVDLDRARVLLPKTKGKDDNPRKVALAPALVAALRAHIEKMGDKPGDTLLFGFETRWGLPQMVARVRKRARLPHYRPHQIGRHAFATRLLHSGASLLDVQKAGGWDSAQMVTDIYGHLSEEYVDGIVAGQKLRTKPRAVKKDGAA
jgi:integrase